ncbi:MAG: BamA/TamA family outer membrane protein [Lentisphaeria bacterium]|nr:BamA/TamA family outer membrane protein [Candidatus Neomarinimicrobiota bacterium]MCF7842686.1 BamA/TamA family outer membrane protein [Lentisphaeria bacterium]
MIMTLFAIPVNAGDGLVQLRIIESDSLTLQETLSPADISSFLDSLVNHSVKSGYFHVKWEVLSWDTTVAPPLIMVKLVKGPSAQIDAIEFRKLAQTDPHILTREFYFGMDSIITPNAIPSAEARINQLDLVTLERVGVFRDTLKERNILVYNAREATTIQFDGVVGAERDPGADSIRWVGSFHVDIPNVMGTGRRLRLDWERSRADAEKFNFTYTEPWILNFPVNGTLGFWREVVNGNYITQRFTLNIDWRVSSWQSVRAVYERLRNTLTFTGQTVDENWRDVLRNSLGLGFTYSPPDKKGAPYFAINTLYKMELAQGNDAVKALSVRTIGRVPLIKSCHYTSRLAFSHYQQGDVETDPSLLQPLGGSRSVRGYFEDQYRGVTTTALQNDLAIDIGKNSRMFIFNDYGWLTSSNNTQTMIGYGFGARVVTNIGPLVISLGKNPALTWRNALIHIQLTGIDRRWIEN